MHTVNKAYTVLKQEGFVKVDRRKGAVIAVDEGKEAGYGDPGRICGFCWPKQAARIFPEEVHAEPDEIYEEYGGLE